MADVHAEFGTLEDSMFLAASILDRFLEKSASIPRSCLQLAGLASMFIACKFEQTSFPSIEDFIEASDRCCSSEDMCKMEINILKKIEWDLVVPTPLIFFRRFAKGFFFLVFSFF